ncbi:MAG: tRNA 2-thiouridine(34) synthase MnmA [Burkholderiales bacterium]
MTRPRIVVAMSGGVDSSVAALLLKQQGYNVVGVFMKNWEDDDRDGYCTAKQDFLDVAAVADIIDIELDVVNFSAEYRDRVFSNFLAEYQAGRTPNPDVLCNSEIKFKAFLEHAMGMGVDHIATGHYARVRKRDGEVELLKAEDGTKDQSYFLYRLNQQQISRTLFPLGELRKREVRAIAQNAGLPNHAKKDSTGICFIGERPFREFLMRYLPKQPGEIETPEGKTVGRHDGLMYYTIGQRHGLRIGGRGEAWFVAGKDLSRNVLIVVQGHNHPALLRSNVKAGHLSWVSGKPPHCHWVYTARTRYRQAVAPCSIAHCGVTCEIEFAEPQWAVTPGQSVVVYESEVCLGGGIIQ